MAMAQISEAELAELHNQNRQLKKQVGELEKRVAALEGSGKLAQGPSVATISSAASIQRDLGSLRLLASQLKRRKIDSTSLLPRPIGTVLFINRNSAISRASLLSLPREIRNMIYSFCVQDSKGISITTSFTTKLVRGKDTSITKIHPSTTNSGLYTALLRTNRMIHHESSEIFYANTFGFTIPVDFSKFFKIIGSQQRWIKSLEFCMTVTDDGQRFSIRMRLIEGELSRLPLLRRLVLVPNTGSRRWSRDQREVFRERAVDYFTTLKPARVLDPVHIGQHFEWMFRTKFHEKKFRVKSDVEAWKELLDVSAFWKDSPAAVAEEMQKQFWDALAEEKKRWDKKVADSFK